MKDFWGEELCDLATTIVSVRKQKNLSQNDLAKLAGVSKSIISKIENCNANPTLDKLLKIGKALDLSLMFVPKKK